MPPQLRLSADTYDFILEPFSIEDLQDRSKCAPRTSSPSPDGLPYRIWHLVFHHPAAQDLIFQVYKQALLDGIFPAS